MESVKSSTQPQSIAAVSADPILDPDAARLVMHPIRYSEIWSAYKKAQGSFWVAEEIDLSTDVVHWTARLSREEQHFFSMILAFFAASDGIVNENLVERFCSEVQIPEARCFYGFQIMMENIHAETYALCLSTLVRDCARQQFLFSAVTSIPSIKAKADWCFRWIEDLAVPFAVRLVTFAAVEGIFFSSSFAAVFWLKSRGLMPGLCQSNELISRDEGLHTDFACLLHNHLASKAPPDAITTLVREAVRLEQAFFRDALPQDFPGMNAEMMADYVEVIADRLLGALGVPPIFCKSNPFPFMRSIALDGRTNFFERRVSEYRLAAASGGVNGSHDFSVDEPF